jgi:glycosyltransferase involved in cell wall biosynthesis
MSATAIDTRELPVIAGLVSTIIPVYNRPVLLQEAVESVLAQTYRPIEVILVNDGSGEHTTALCDRLAAAHNEVIVTHRTHTGLAGQGREAGRRIARGEYIQYLDSDDILLPRKFEVMVHALASRPDCDVAYCYTRRRVRGQPAEDTPTERTGETFEYMLPDFIQQRFWHTSTPLYTRRICDAVGSWTSLRFWEDVEYDLRIALRGVRLLHCREFLVEFRDHGEERLSHHNFFTDPDCLRHAPAAYVLIGRHVRSSGVNPGHPAVQAFAAEVRFVAERCRDAGLHAEADECLAVIDCL